MSELDDINKSIDQLERSIKSKRTKLAKLLKGSDIMNPNDENLRQRYKLRMALAEEEQELSGLLYLRKKLKDLGYDQT